MLFASEIKAILKDPSVNRALRPEAVYDYLRFQYNPRHETVFRDIFRLKPGTMLVVSEEGISTRRYWKIPVKDHGGPSWASSSVTLYDGVFSVMSPWGPFSVVGLIPPRSWV